VGDGYEHDGGRWLDGLVTSEKLGESTSALASTLQLIRADCSRLTGDFSPLGECVPFSPPAYNAISASVLESLYDCIEQIDSLAGLEFHFNLGVLLYRELHGATCQHYFQEYERIFEFVDIRPQTGRPLGWRSSPRQLIKQGAGKLSSLISNSVDRLALRSASRVGWTGYTTFPWEALRSELSDRRIRFLPIQGNGSWSIPMFSAQAEVLRQWTSDLHQRIAVMMGTRGKVLRPLEARTVASCCQRLSSIPTLSRESYDLVLTGTLGNLDSRVIALQAQSQGISVMTLHHGAHFLIFDEPYYALYEGALPDVKVVFGSIEAQRDLGTLGPRSNLAGHPIVFYSRSDPLVQRVYSPDDIKPCTSLKGLTSVYLAVEFESGRYGPYRDVHPSTYLTWQEKLLEWLERVTGNRPLLRLHPKRRSTRYDPVGYKLLEGDMEEVLEVADVFAIDYPTTSLAYVAATSKPVLFFNIGLRRLHPAALEVVQGRCHYAAVDLLCPDEGFAAIESNLSRDCTHTFSPVFSVATNSQHEVGSVTDAVCSEVSRRA